MSYYNYSASLPPLKKGATLNHDQYEIIGDTVNAGGFGRIYRAYGSRFDKNGNRHVVAIKEFCVNEFQNYLENNSIFGSYTKMGINKRIKVMRAKFRQEANLLSKLNEQRDRHVPWIHGNVFKDGERLFYAMTYIDGPTLTQVVNKQGIMSEDIAIDYIVQIGKVLYKAHRWGVIHCDISPNNIMLQENFAVLVDFGNAKSYTLLDNLTDTPKYLIDEIELAGTPGFSPSPDYIGSSQGDVYSLAATLYFLLTGKKPGTLSTKHSLDIAKSLLVEKNVSAQTIIAIMNALDVKSENCTTDAKAFLSELPHQIVFESLLNYNDYDYDKR